MALSTSRDTRISVDNAASAAFNVTLPTQRLKLEVANVASAAATCSVVILQIKEQQYNWESIMASLVDSQLILSTPTRAPPVMI